MGLVFGLLIDSKSKIKKVGMKKFSPTISIKRFRIMNYLIRFILIIFEILALPFTGDSIIERK
jgi:hypothetical protein